MRVAGTTLVNVSSVIPQALGVLNILLPLLVKSNGRKDSFYFPFQQQLHLLVGVI